MSKSIRKELRFPQTPDEVWQALTDPAVLAEWMYPNDFAARVGHRFTFRVPPNPAMDFEGLTVHCEVLKCEPPKALSFTWVAGEINTRIDYSLEAEGKGTKVLFVHSGFEQDPAYHGAGYGWGIMHEKMRAILSRNPAA